MTSLVQDKACFRYGTVAGVVIATPRLLYTYIMYKKRCIVLVIRTLYNANVTFHLCNEQWSSFILNVHWVESLLFKSVCFRLIYSNATNHSFNMQASIIERSHSITLLSIIVKIAVTVDLSALQLSAIHHIIMYLVSHQICYQPSHHQNIYVHNMR